METHRDATARGPSSTGSKIGKSTALMQAVKERRIEAVYSLAERECGCLDEKGDTALILAASSGNYDAVFILAPLEAGVRGPGRQTALMHLSSLGCPPQLLKQLIHAEARLTDDRGWTALMFAALWGHIEVVSHLADLEAGMQDQDGMTALMYATSKKRLDVVEYLLIHHARKEAGRQNNLGRTALMIAATLNGAESCMIVQKLVAKEAKIKDRDGLTALMLAARCDNESNIDTLIHLSHLEAKMQDSSGRTALIHACLHGSGTALEVLARNEVGLLDKHGCCALNYCIEDYKVTFYPYLVSELDIISRRNPYKQLFSRRTLLIDLVFLSSHYKIASILMRWLHAIVVKLGDTINFDMSIKSNVLDLSIYTFIELLFNYYVDCEPITISDLLHSYDALLDVALETHLHTMCSICLDFPASVIYRPCRHMVVCTQCYKRSEQLRSKCVICMSSVSDAIVVSLFECK